jgi:hypothetical protein
MAEYQRQTDQVHEIELPSAISLAMWDRSATSVGEEVGLHVYTHFVGDGSEMRITIRNSSGRRLDRLEGRVYGNRFRGTYTVSDRAREAIYFEAELKKHGLTKISTEMEIIPPITITNAQWSQQEAGRGDILELTADVSGAPDGTEALIKIYEYDEDETHDFVTKFPTLVENGKIKAEWEYEYYEDTDDIPTAEESERGYNPPEYFFKVIIRGTEVESQLLEFKDWIEFRFQVDEENYLPDVQATFTYPDGQQETRVIPEDGVIRFDNIPPGRYTLEVQDYDVLIQGEI